MKLPTMAPSIRAAYRKALEELAASGQEAKPLYHFSKNVDELMSNPKTSWIGGEEYKPQALYASSSLVDNMSSTVGEAMPPREYVEQMLRDSKSGFVRVVPKPEAKINTVHEPSYLSQYDQAYNANIQKILRGEKVPELESLDKSTWGDADITHVMDVDGVSGLRETLIRNPKAVRFFSKDKMLMAALAAGAGGTALLGMPDDASALTPLQFWKAVKQSGYAAEPRGEQATIARAVRKLPKDTLDKIDTVFPETTESLGKAYGKSYSSGYWRGSPNMEASTTELYKANIGLNAERRSLETPIHEALHNVWLDKVLLRDKAMFVGAFKDFKRSGLLPMLENLFDTSLDTPAELFAEYGANKLMRTANHNFLSQMDPKIAKLLDAALAKYERVVPSKVMKEGAPTPDVQGSVGPFEPPPGTPPGPRPSIFSKLAKKIGIPAVAGAGVAGATMLSPDESQAMPLGKLTKQTLASATKLLDKPKAEESAFQLIGKKLSLPVKGVKQEVEVVDVRLNPKNNWRYLVLENEAGDRFQLPMTKDYLNVLHGATGTQDYLEQFAGHGQRGKNYQALRSLTRREAQREEGSIDPRSIRDFKAFNTMQAAKAHEIDPSLLNDYVYVKTDAKSPLLYMPRAYAEFLQQKGHLQIVGEGPKFK